jgi:glycosyltransferase involved in cell wall biosynthesis
MRIDQFLPTFTNDDAIGNHVIRSRQVFRRAGFESHVWAEEIFGTLHHQARSYLEYSPGADVLLYHASTNSRMAEFLLNRPEPVLVYYHNITPLEFFARWEPQAAMSMKAARVELRQLAAIAQLGMAPSRYSECELIDVGYRATALTPLLIDFDRYQQSPNAKVMARLKQRDRGGAHWLFVGRLAPNKCQHDVIGAFAVYRQFFDPKARLTLIGGVTSDLYYRALRRLVVELEVEGTVEILGSIPFDELLAYYRNCDVFVCLSEHEGFCVPIVEAMHFGIPVIGYSAAAVPETIGDAGLVLADRDPLMVACAVDRVLSDRAVSAHLVRAGQRRVDQLALPKSSEALLNTLSAFMVRQEAEHG